MDPKWFQIRLSTAITLTLAACVLIGVNFLQANFHRSVGHGVGYHQGWPLYLHSFIYDKERGGEHVFAHGFAYPELNSRYIALDVLAALIVLGLLAFVLQANHVGWDGGRTFKHFFFAALGGYVFWWLFMCGLFDKYIPLHWPWDWN